MRPGSSSSRSPCNTTKAQPCTSAYTSCSYSEAYSTVCGAEKAECYLNVFTLVTLGHVYCSADSVMSVPLQKMVASWEAVKQTMCMLQALLQAWRLERITPGSNRQHSGAHAVCTAYLAQEHHYVPSLQARASHVAWGKSSRPGCTPANQSSWCSSTL